MSYALTAAGAFLLFIMMIVTLSPSTNEVAAMSPSFVTAGYVASGSIFLIGVILYVLQNWQEWKR